MHNYTIWNRKFALTLIAALGLFGCDSQDKAALSDAEKKPAGPTIEAEGLPQPEPEAPRLPEVVISSGCTVDFTSQKVDGSSLWSDLPDAGTPVNCNFHRTAYNNFLYFIGGGDQPRFMTELGSTADLTTGAPFPGSSSVLKLRQIKNTIGAENPPPGSSAQAGDGFSLIDAAGQTVMYDIRINETFWNTANSFDATSLAAAQQAFKADPLTGGIWLAPTKAGDSDSIEIKTSWRNYGAEASACPSAIMFCEQDSDGNTWGLLGMHYVQKTPTRGEFIWGSFEHAGNAPDCQPGASNPLRQQPRDPANPSATINVNTGSLANETGWATFNFSSYGGNGASCDFPMGAISTTGCASPSGSPQCNADPNNGSGGFKFVNVCRTDPIPDHSTVAATNTVCANTNNNENNVACLTQSVLDHWPASLDKLWKYYMLIGTEWLNATSVPLVGCENINNATTGAPEFACPAAPQGPSIPSFNTTGTTALANTTMETWMQEAMCQTYSTPSGPQTFAATDCFTCHTPQTAGSTGDFSHVFSVF